jgi:hypothetical protein
VRIVHYFLNGEPIGLGYCGGEDCTSCPIRFECYTTAKDEILQSFYPMAVDLHGIQPYVFDLGQFRVMRCPHCQGLFKVTYDQLNWSTKFKCKKCGRYNQGSCEADKYGVLIGELNGISEHR